MESIASKDLKAELINIILEINDSLLLKKVKSFIESEVDEDIYTLNNDQKERVKKAIYQYNNNETIDNQMVHEEITKWLNEE